MTKKVKTKDVPSKGEPTTGVTRPLKIGIYASVGRKFLRMTLAERTKFVELFAGFEEREWRAFRRWIKKLGGK